VLTGEVSGGGEKGREKRGWDLWGKARGGKGGGSSRLW